MKVQGEQKEFVQCPVCNEHEWRVDQCKGHQTFGPWSCAKCLNYFRFTRLHDGDYEDVGFYEVEQVDGPEGRNTPITVTLRSVTVPPITLKLNAWKCGHSQKDTPEEFIEHERYYFNEHTCPTNWTKQIEAMEFKGDHDPHGVFEFVSVEDGHYVDPNDMSYDARAKRGEV